MRVRRVIRPVLLEVEGEHGGLYELHLGRPGRPHVYARVGKQGLRRVKDPAALEVVARRYGELVVARRRALEAERARQARWWFRAKVWVGRVVARVVAWLRRAWQRGGGPAAY